MRLLADRFDRMKADVDVGIVERGDERVDRFRPALAAERQRRLDPQSRRRRGAISEISASVTSTPVSDSSCSALLSRLKLRWPSRSAAITESTSGASRRAASARTAARRTCQSSSPSADFDRAEAVGRLERRRGGGRRATPVGRVALAQLPRQLPLAFEPGRHVLDA